MTDEERKQIREFAAAVCLELIRKSGVREWEDDQVRLQIVQATNEIVTEVFNGPISQ